MAELRFPLFPWIPEVRGHIGGVPGALIDAFWTPEQRADSSRGSKLQRARPDPKLVSLGKESHPLGAAGPRVCTGLIMWSGTV